MIETKDFRIQGMQANVADMTFNGYASTWDEDLRGDIISKGAFAKTIEKRGPQAQADGSYRSDVKILWQHDWDRPIGLPTKMNEDQRGLYVEGSVIDTPDGLNAIKCLQSGVVDKMSIGYTIIRAENRFDEDTGDYQGRNINEVKLFEFSPVTFPANEAADITGVKQLEQMLRAFRRGNERETGLQLCGAANLPLAPDDHLWDRKAAMRRVSDWAGERLGRQRKAYVLAHMNGLDTPATMKMLFADVIAGELHAVPAALKQLANAIMMGQMRSSFPDSTLPIVKAFLGEYFQQMGAKAPWSSVQASILALGEGFAEHVRAFVLGAGTSDLGIEVKDVEGGVIANPDTVQFIEAMSAEGDSPAWLKELLRNLVPASKARENEGDQADSTAAKLLKTLTEFRLTA